MSATLQNGIRVRLFLITLVGIAIRVAREYSSASVHKASGILETNFFLYGIVVFCSLLPYKNTWFAAIVAQISATLLGAVTLGLGIMATLRCRTQTGCIKTLPTSALTLVLMALALTLDALQTWDIYRVIRAPMFVSSATQRIRILFAWALPFGWLVNILMFADSHWEMFKFTTAHLFVDPLVILLANEREDTFVTLLIATAISMDILAWNMQTDALAQKAHVVQLGLASGALIIHMLADTPPDEAEQDGQEADDADDVEDDFEVAEAQHLRQRKSHKHKIKF